MNPRSRRDAYGSRINRDHSPTLALLVPWASILLATIVQIMPIATAVPVFPPLGLMLLLAWRLVRPGLFPIWAGFPLGLFDDLFSGQPFGSAIMLWSLAMIAIEIFDARIPWRSFLLDWLVATGVIATYLLVAALFSGAPFGWPALLSLVPQVLLSVLLFPMIARMVSWLDRLRLLRIKVLR